MDMGISTLVSCKHLGLKYLYTVRYTVYPVLLLHVWPCHIACKDFSGLGDKVAEFSFTPFTHSNNTPPCSKKQQQKNKDKDKADIHEGQTLDSFHNFRVVINTFFFSREKGMN